MKSEMETVQNQINSDDTNGGPDEPGLWRMSDFNI